MSGMVTQAPIQRLHLDMKAMAEGQNLEVYHC
jgi:hypothetical protein